MIYIILLFVGHWVISLFFHTAFLHRYASHKMYTMGPKTEKAFYFLTWMSQGSSFLVPRAYALMHRMHHEYSDTEKDPHSPVFYKDVIRMMQQARKIYGGFVTGELTPESKFCYDLPVWEGLDKFGDRRAVRVMWGVLYTLLYLFIIQHFHLSYFWLLLLPIHYLMGPVQGAIVNWFGHKVGYQNYDNGDNSRNTEVWGIIMQGELFQNNHHKAPKSLNFASKWYEFDPAFVVIKVLDKMRIVKIVPQQA